MVPAATRPAARELDDLTLRRAQRGDGAAFREVVERHHRAVWDLVTRLLAGTALAHRAEDLVQDTFVRVHRALPGFDPAGPARLSTWILTIASRLALNELRRAPRAAATVPLDAAVDVAAAGESPAGALEREERAIAVARAIAALPEAGRVIVLLRAYHDLDYAEIADVLEVDVGTVKSRLSRARAQLRARLRPHDRGDDHA
ncbi:MAG: sigma-70 family RNA polymerase sigma factor [Kofleriaceae bacterium]|nr:sigma-70 family RNA polymerase sigma factor [Kofleriaceae bacterium]MCB9572570.1 sigma-70 family RNA polymerase sigma factor [Kofleriaceae bacterium]